MAAEERIRISITEKALEDPRRLIRAIEKFLTSTMRVALQNVRNEITKRAPTGAQGILSNSIVTAAPVVRKGRIEGRITTNVKYALPVERGRKAGAPPPPIGPIKEWLKRVKGVPSGRTLDRSAFILAKKIGERGIDPVRFIEKGVKKTRPEVRKLFRNAFKQLAGRGGG